MNEMHDVVKADSGVVGFFKNVLVGVMLLVVLAITLLFSFGAVVSHADDTYSPLPVDTHFNYDIVDLGGNFPASVYYDVTFLGETDSYHFVLKLSSSLVEDDTIWLSERNDSMVSALEFTYDSAADVYYCNFSRTSGVYVFDSVGISSDGGEYSSTVYFSTGDYIVGSGMPSEPLVNQFIGVWGGLVDCISGLFPDISLFFYADDELTFAGVCAVIMAGVALILLVFNLVRSFLTMRG